MRKRFAARWILPAGILLAVLLAGTALADPDLFFVSQDGQFGVQSITLTRAGNRYYLFLPGNTERVNLKIGVGPGTDAILNGEPVTGSETAADLEKHNEIELNRKKYEFEVMQGSENLPALYITTETGSLDRIQKSKKNKETGSLMMTDETGATVYDGVLDYIKMRGNASTAYAKKNYQIKLDMSTDLLGMGKARKWILTGNWLDKSLIRNEMTFDLAEFIGMRFTPQRQQAELYINHEYIGLYLFSEKVEIGKSRISIRDLDLLTIGMVNDMYIESSNDNAEDVYCYVATQREFDAF